MEEIYSISYPDDSAWNGRHRTGPTPGVKRARKGCASLPWHRIFAIAALSVMIDEMIPPCSETGPEAFCIRRRAGNR